MSVWKFVLTDVYWCALPIYSVQELIDNPAPSQGVNKAVPDKTTPSGMAFAINTRWVIVRWFCSSLPACNMMHCPETKTAAISSSASLQIVNPRDDTTFAKKVTSSAKPAVSNAKAASSASVKPKTDNFRIVCLWAHSSHAPATLLHARVCL